jgi:hypothetical protein
MSDTLTITPKQSVSALITAAIKAEPAFGGKVQRVTVKPCTVPIEVELEDGVVVDATLNVAADGNG